MAIRQATKYTAIAPHGKGCGDPDPRISGTNGSVTGGIVASRRENVAHSRGVRSGDMVQITYGYGLFTGGLGLHGGAECLGCTVVPVSGGYTARQVQIIDEFKPRVIAVTPSYMLAIADEFARQGLDPRQCSLQIGMFGAEPWTEAMRSEIEMNFDLQALDIYNRFPTQIEEILLRDGRVSPHYRIEVRRPGRLDELTVVVEARIGAADDKTRESAGRDLARRIKSRIGVSSDVKVTEPESLERSVGKARRVVDLRPED